MFKPYIYVHYLKKEIAININILVIIFFFPIDTQGQVWRVSISRYSSFLAYKLPVEDVHPLSQAFHKLEAGKDDHFKIKLPKNESRSR